MKKKNEMRIICGSKMLPPPATHPTAGGIAPTNEPGMIAKGETFFNGV
jgi:hypothetical protein